MSAPKKIAVIAVHGVADQKPKNSAREVANLLADLIPDRVYSGFVEREIRVPLKPVLGTRAKTAARGMLAEAFRIDEESVLERAAEREHGADDIDLQFMADQLSDYEQGVDRVFETVRLEANRGEAGPTVHVYEAHWADLSKLGTGLVAFFGELYQLLLHLPSLGRTVVHGECALRGKRREWRTFAFFQRWLVRWLTLFIAPLNLVLLTFVLPLISTQLGEKAPKVSLYLAVAVAALMIAAIAGLALKGRVLPWPVWSAAPLVAAGAGSFAAFWLARASSPTHVLMFEVWLIAALLIAAVLKSYNERRPGALGVGGLMLLATGGAFLWTLARTTEIKKLPHAALRMIEITNTALQLVWRVHVPWLLVTMVVALICIAASREQRWRATRAAWTAIVSVGLATTVFANLTLAFWAALLKATAKVLPGAASYEPLPTLPFAKLLCISEAPTAALTVDSWVKEAIVASASRAFVFFALILILFFLALVWSIFPSVIVEARPPEADPRPRRMVALGRWLSNGMMSIPWAALLPAVALVSLIVVCALKAHDQKDSQLSTSAILSAGGAIIAIIAARFWLPGASAALDVALDVDNYLREHPRRSTPRARIAERFTSLIGFIRNPRMSGHEYDMTIIVAHSQGSVITADLLRFLNWLHHPAFSALRERPVFLFTMGCPLRQLYARAFSPLYQWMVDSGAPSNGGIPDDAAPDPRSLGVDTWMNAYRSGDYVGRNVWCNRRFPDVWKRRRNDPQNVGRPEIDEDSRGARREMCIGEGAHTHYWDRNGVDIARELDDMITGVTAPAVRLPLPPPPPPAAPAAADSIGSGG